MSRPIRVVHVNDIAFVGSTLVRALRSEGVDATLIEPPRIRATIRRPWRLAMLPLRAIGLLAAAGQVRFGRYDLAHVHFARLGIVGPLGGVPYVLHCHGSDIRGVRPRSAWGRAVRPFLRGAALVYYSTPDLAPWVTAFRPDAIFLPNPIELPEWTTAAATAPRDLLVGVRLDPIKGVDAIAAVVEEVVQRRPSTSITVVDQGHEVGRVLAAAGPAARLVGPAAHLELPALLREHRIAIGQMSVGALGNYELEAMAASIPVAASFRFPAAYAAPPPVIDGASPAASADRIVALLDDESARGDLAQVGRQWVGEHHAAAAVARRVAADYRSLLGR